jgi:holliday junction DNA helicase RuvA
MIASLRGNLVATGTDWAIIEVNGVGFRVSTPTSTLALLGKPGSSVYLHTHLHVREDNIALFGFSTFEELGLFQILTGVSGIGPKLAMSMLSAMKPEELVGIIVSGNAEMLTSIPGIGKKIAGRLILELKDKIGTISSVVPVQISDGNADVLAVLTSLGYSSAEANRAATSIADSSLSLEEKVKLALAYFSRKV